MNRDRLFLLRPGFTDPAYPGRSFYCWHCALIEGVLASFPDLAERLDVARRLAAAAAGRHRSCRREESIAARARAGKRRDIAAPGR
jgi:Protein of unknown function (DUF3088)